jgi:hypothetical protein
MSAGGDTDAEDIELHCRQISVSQSHEQIFRYRTSPLIASIPSLSSQLSITSPCCRFVIHSRNCDCLVEDIDLKLSKSAFGSAFLCDDPKISYANILNKESRDTVSWNSSRPKSGQKCTFIQSLNILLAEIRKLALNLISHRLDQPNYISSSE